MKTDSSARSARKIHLNGLLPFVIFLCLAVVTVAIWQRLRDAQEESRTLAGNQESAAVTTEIRERLQLHGQLLRATHAFAASGRAGDLAAWRRFTDAINVNDNLAGLFAIAYAPLIPYRERDRFIAGTRKHPDLAEFSIFPAPRSDVALPVIFVAPDKTEQRKALGYNLMAEEIRRETVERATIQRDLVMSAPVVLIMDHQEKRPGLMLMQALYRPGMPIESVEERRSALSGMVLTAYRIDEFISTLRRNPNSRFTLQIFDESLGGSNEKPLPPKLIYATNPEFSPATGQPYFHHEIDFGGRNWVLHFYPHPSEQNTNGIDLPTLVLVGGLLCNALLALLIFYFATHRQRAEAYAQQVTTSLRQSEAELREADRLKQAILDAATGVAIIATDTCGLITAFNPGAEKMLGYKASEIVGLGTPLRLHLASEVEARCREISAALGRPVMGFDVFTTIPTQEGQERREWTYLHRDGRALNVDLTVTAERDAAGEIIGYLGIAIDISERKRVEESLLQHQEHLQELVAERTAQLEKALKQARTANRAKSELLANMSHELRTPMHAILSFSELGKGRTGGPGQEKFLQYFTRIEQSAGRLLGLVNELLDLAKLEATAMQLDLVRCDLHEIIVQAAEQLDSLIQERHLSLTIENQLGNCSLEGHPARLTQVFLNLLSNAIKFSTDGGAIGIALSAGELPAGRRVADQGMQPALVVSVIDAGIGIPPEELESIFDKFVQSSLTKNGAGGTGLGLAISRAIVHQHHGTIVATNSTQGGACFTVTLPIKHLP